MPRLDIAEVILSFAADRERATAIAGDLAEESRGSALRFWWLVAQTSFLQTSRQLSASPLAMLGPAVRAMLSQFLWIVALFLITFVGLLAVEAVSKVFFHRDIPAAFLYGHGFQTIGTWLYGLVIPFMIGRSMARRYPGREGSGIASVVGLNVVFLIVTSWLEWEFVHVGPNGIPFFANHGLRAIEWNIDLLIGTVAAIGGELLNAVMMAAGAAFARFRSIQN